MIAPLIAVGGALRRLARYRIFEGLALARGPAVPRGTPPGNVTGSVAIGGAAVGPFGAAQLIRDGIARVQGVTLRPRPAAGAPRALRRARQAPRRRARP